MSILGGEGGLFPWFVAHFSLALGPQQLAVHPLVLATELDPWLHDAVAARRIEFLAGRACARQALRASLCQQVAGVVPVGPDGAPIWPTGMVGSISHTQGLVSAAVCSQEHAVGLGLDVQRLLSEAECAAFDRCSEAHELSLAMRAARLTSAQAHSLLFAAKEAVFKCLYPTIGRYFKFRSVEVEVSPASAGGTGQFQAHLPPSPLDVAGAPPNLVGRFQFDLGHVHTGVTWLPEPPNGRC